MKTKISYRLIIVSIFLLGMIHFHVQAQVPQTSNKPERTDWFQNLGFGMFIHWGVDVSLGGVISHSLVGSSDDFAKKYFTTLPQYFNPEKFNPKHWAKLARLAGMKYVVFTTKHHSGFCMWNTKTTDFGVMNTPFKRDITKEVIEAFRAEGIAIGLYFSPEDFYYLYQHQIQLNREHLPEHFPATNPGLMDLDKRQLKELFTSYGKIDILFIDGPAEGLREYAWSLEPNLVITRGGMKTPEQNTPDTSLPRPWESCYTMGTDWGYKATNDPHKSGTDIINMLIEIRAKGGNFLLNIGPKPNGEIQAEQEDRLMEVALWNFANSEAIYQIKPLPVIRDEKIWYSQSNDEKYIYAYILRDDANDWKYGTRKTILLPRVIGTVQTKVSILGYKSEVLEYNPNVDAKIYATPSPTGLIVNALNGQRFYTNNQWPNAMVLKIENAKFNSAKNIEGRKEE